MNDTAKFMIITNAEGEVITDEMISEKASEISSWVESAIMDVAYDAVRLFEEQGQTFDPAQTKHLKKLKRDGVTDLSGRYADDLYNDAGTLRDLMGDRIFDAVNMLGFGYDNRTIFEAVYNRIVEKLGERSNHTAWVEALVELHHPRN
jgi:hypothetical protein